MFLEAFLAGLRPSLGLDRKGLSTISFFSEMIILVALRQSDLSILNQQKSNLHIPDPANHYPQAQKAVSQGLQQIRSLIKIINIDFNSIALSR